ncbi:MAG: hypothetical protein ACFFG0_03475 [Candidatus Thorarchaeota archaeon]
MGLYADDEAINIDDLKLDDENNDGENNDGKNEGNNEGDKKDKKSATIPAWRFKEVNDRMRAAEEREAILLQNQARLEEEMEKIKFPSQTKDIDSEIAELRRLKSENPEKEDEYNELINDLKIEKRVQAALEQQKKELANERSRSKDEIAFEKAWTKAVDLVPEFAKGGTKESARGIELGQELNLMVMNPKTGKYDFVSPQAPLIIARIIAAEKNETKKPNKRPTLPISGNGRGSAPSGLKTMRELNELRKNDRKAYDSYMSKNYKHYERR